MSANESMAAFYLIRYEDDIFVHENMQYFCYMSCDYCIENKHGHIHPQQFTFIIPKIVFEIRHPPLTRRKQILCVIDIDTSMALTQAVADGCITLGFRSKLH